MKIETKHNVDGVNVRVDFEDDRSIKKIMDTLFAICEATINEISRVAEEKHDEDDAAGLRKNLFKDLSNIFSTIAEEEVNG